MSQLTYRVFFYSLLTVSPHFDLKIIFGGDLLRDYFVARIIVSGFQFVVY